MDEARRTAERKFLSLLLRHQPEILGLVLDEAGWVSVTELLTAYAAHGRALTRAELELVVATSPKQRFALSADGQRIRANQGHSVDVQLGYREATPPSVLYHGTARHILGHIQREGLRRMARHHVHLSTEVGTARLVGPRHGEVVVLRVEAAAMAQAGRRFFCTANGVWLTEAVPAQFLSVVAAP